MGTGFSSLEILQEAESLEDQLINSEIWDTLKHFYG